MCHETEKTAYLARHCHRNGVFNHAIYHPTVPKGKARLRASVLSCHSIGDLDCCARMIINGAKELGII